MQQIFLLSQSLILLSASLWTVLMFCLSLVVSGNCLPHTTPEKQIRYFCTLSTLIA